MQKRASGDFRDKKVDLVAAAYRGVTFTILLQQKKLRKRVIKQLRAGA